MKKKKMIKKTERRKKIKKNWVAISSFLIVLRNISHTRLGN